MFNFIFWQIDNPTSEICGDLHPRDVLEYCGSMMGGFIAVRVADVCPELPPFLIQVEDWPQALKSPGYGEGGVIMSSGLVVV